MCVRVNRYHIHGCSFIEWWTGCEGGETAILGSDSISSSVSYWAAKQSKTNIAGKCTIESIIFYLLLFYIRLRVSFHLFFFNFFSSFQNDKWCIYQYYLLCLCCHPFIPLLNEFDSIRYDSIHVCLLLNFSLSCSFFLQFSSYSEYFNNNKAELKKQDEWFIWNKKDKHRCLTQQKTQTQCTSLEPKEGQFIHSFNWFWFHLNQFLCVSTQ